MHNGQNSKVQLDVFFFHGEFVHNVTCENTIITMIVCSRNGKTVFISDGNLLFHCLSESVPTVGQCKALDSYCKCNTLDTFAKP